MLLLLKQNRPVNHQWQDHRTAQPTQRLRKTITRSCTRAVYCSAPTASFSARRCRMDACRGREEEEWRSKWDPNEMPRCVNGEGWEKWPEGGREDWLDWLHVGWKNGHTVILVFAKSAWDGGGVQRWSRGGREKDMVTEEKAAGSPWEQRIINVRLIKSY